MLITRRVYFSASHVCAQPDWPAERNRAVYGPAANPHGHGHNYVLDVTLDGVPDPATGMVIDLKEVKEIVERQVVQRFDHRFLNREVPPFDRLVPTPENIALEVWNLLEPQFRGGRARLHGVRLYETEDLFVDYHGEAAS